MWKHNRVGGGNCSTSTCVLNVFLRRRELELPVVHGWRWWSVVMVIRRPVVSHSSVCRGVDLSPDVWRVLQRVQDGHCDADQSTSPDWRCHPQDGIAGTSWRTWNAGVTVQLPPDFPTFAPSPRTLYFLCKLVFVKRGNDFRNLWLICVILFPYMRCVAKIVSQFY